MNFRVPRGSLL